MNSNFILIDNNIVALKTENGNIIIENSDYYKNETETSTIGIKIWYQKDDSEHMYELVDVEEDIDNDPNKVDVWIVDEFEKNDNKFLMSGGESALYFDVEAVKPKRNRARYNKKNEYVIGGVN